jgi:hypothetical protein
LAGSQAEDLEPASKDKQFLGWANIFRAVAHGLMAHRKVRKIRSGGRPVRHRSAHSAHFSGAGWKPAFQPTAIIEDVKLFSSEI